MTRYEVTFNLSYHSYIVDGKSEEEAKQKALVHLAEDLLSNLKVMIEETTFEVRNER